MAIQVGDKFPEVTLKSTSGEDVSTGELMRGKQVVLFALPGAFTPTCSAKHLPGFIEKADEIRKRGVDEIVCVSVNDFFVMDAWAKAQNAGTKVKLLADGNGDLARALGLDFDASKFGMGRRAQRFAAIVVNGVVKHLAVEQPMKFEVSSAEAVLKAL